MWWPDERTAGTCGFGLGRLYGAYLPKEVVKPMDEQERRSGAQGALPAWQAFAAGLAEVREQGLSRTEGSVVAGVSAMSAPVFDHRGQIVLAITAIGTAPSFDTRWDGALAQALRQSAAAVSERLGWRAGG